MRRQSRAERQGVDARVVGVDQGVGTHIERLHAALERPERGRDVLGAPDFEHVDLEAKLAGCCLRLGDLQRGVGRSDIADDRQPTEAGEHLAQKLDPFAGKIARLDRQAGDVAARPREACNQPASNRIPRQREHDRNRRRLPALRRGQRLQPRE